MKTTNISIWQKLLKNIKISGNVEGQYSALCPFKHNGVQEENNSFSYNIVIGKYFCHACDRAGLLKNLLNDLELEELDTIIDFYNVLAQEQLPKNISYVYDKKLLDLEFDVQVLKDNKVYQDKYATFCIPVYLKDKLVEIRYYNRNSKPKVYGVDGVNAGIPIIPKKINSSKSVLICEGEKDMLMALSQKFNAITFTGGANANFSYIKLLKGYTYFICYDNDTAGKKGSEKLAQILYDNKIDCYIANNFHETCKDEGDDIYDFFIKYKKTKKDLIEYLKLAEKYTGQIIKVDEHKTIFESTKNINIYKIYETEILVSTFINTPFSILQSAIFYFKNKLEKYSKLWLYKENAQDLVNLINNIGDTYKYIINRLDDNPKFLEKIKKQQYISCYKQSIKDINDDKLLEYDSIITNKNLDLGFKYSIKYKLAFMPRTNKIIVVILEAVAIDDFIDNFELTGKIKKSLIKFKDLKSNDIKTSLNNYYKDLRKSRYNAYINYNAWITTELVYHSQLEYYYKADEPIKGVLDILEIGESRIGKSECVKIAKELYQLGRIIDMKNATPISLIGGSAKVANENRLKAGVLPIENKGLVCLEEFQGVGNEAIKILTEIRSNKRAIITRVDNNIDLPCNVRMLSIANPITKDGKPTSMFDFVYGVDMLTALVNSAEDIARYDLVVMLTSEEYDLWNIKISDDVILKKEDYYNKIRWVWSRTKDNIKINADIWGAIGQNTEDGHTITNKDNLAILIEKYDCSIKLIGVDIEKKVVKLAVALAGLLVNTDEEFKNIIVTKQHIKYIMELLDDTYSSNVFRLDKYAEYEKLITVCDKYDLEIFKDLAYNKMPSIIKTLYNIKTITIKASEHLFLGDTPNFNNGLTILLNNYFVIFDIFNGISATPKFRKAFCKLDSSKLESKIENKIRDYTEGL